MKRLLHLQLEILQECGSLCGVSTTRDAKYIASRFEHEGVSFLTITLPAFAKDFEQALDRGKVDDDLFPSYKKGSGGLPLVLGGFLRLVFDPVSGNLLDDPSVDAIFFVRQITMAFGKIFALPSNKRQWEAMRQFIETDREVQASAIALYSAQRHHRGGRNHPRPSKGGLGADEEGEPCPTVAGLRGGPSYGQPQDRASVGQGRLRDMLESFQQVALHLFRDVLGELDRQSYTGGFVHQAVPKHGPGQTADRVLGNSKYRPSSYPHRLNAEFPIADWIVPNYRHWEWLDRVNLLPLAQELPVRVISVPKTMKTSRIIAIEPIVMQYTQQAVMREIVPALEQSWAGAFLGFTDQEPNQLMAVEGSSKGNLATLDLSEASDRVSMEHVRLLLKPWPNLLRKVMACRSRKAHVSGFGVHHLAKYASMGSALTFPLEAMLFTSIVISAVLEERRLPVSRKSIQRLAGSVRVFGDDIICPSDTAERVTEWLDAFGLRVNQSKSFWTGKFRESCGVDAYDGQDVTPVRFREFLPQSRDDVEEIISLISTRNQFYLAGLWRTAKVLDEYVQRFARHFPIVEETSPIFGRTSVSFQPVAERIHPDYQVPLVKGLVVKSILPVDILDDVPALMKWLLYSDQTCTCLEAACSGSHREPLAVDHLQRSGRPRTVLQTGWRQPY